MKTTLVIGIFIGIVLITGCGKDSVTAPRNVDPIVPQVVLDTSNQTDGRTIIGVYVDEGAHPSCVTAAEAMFTWMGYEIVELQAVQINSGRINTIDVFYFPGGSSAPYISRITEVGRSYLREKISLGSGYIGTCAGALYACESQIWDGWMTTVDHGQLGIFPGIGRGPNTDIVASPSIGMVEIQLNKPHPSVDGEGESMWILFYNGPVFQLREDAGASVIGTYSINGGNAIVACSYGNGRVFLTGPHPEWEEDSDRDGISYFDNYDDRGSDWDMMKNATRWCLREL